MKRIFLILVIPLILINQSFSQGTVKTSIAWDSWGVPHITSDNLKELFFAQGWAQMHNHANHILKLYGTSRGRAAEYWGPDNLTNDMMIHTLGFSELADEWDKNQDPVIKTIYESFIDGLNAYASENPDAINKELIPILPLTTKDLNMHTMFVVFTRFVSGRELQITQRWPDLGSNTIAVGPSRSASGNAMLIQNPHLPWYGEFLFFESHLMYNDMNIYGVTLVGLPGIVMGFNQYLGWGNTNNPIDNSDLYELELENNGYLIEGERYDFEMSSATIKIKQEDGSLTEQTIPIMNSKFGPVVKVNQDKALALRWVAKDRPNMVLQAWNMINSKNFNEFEDALRMAQIPFWNVMYADRDGTIFYLFNGLIPKRSSGDWGYWRSLVKGGKSADIWTEMHSYDELPKVKNPSSGWLQNANDPPWTSTLPRAIESKDFPAYFSPDVMFFRAQGASNMLMNDESITYKELVDFKLSTKLPFAERILDDLLAAIDENPSPLLEEAKDVLEDWDLHADSDSEGALLFYKWAKNFSVFDQGLYQTKWDITKPNITPDGLANPDEAVKKLEVAAKEIKDKYGELEVKWGDYYKIKYGDTLLPGNGMEGWSGSFRSVWSEQKDEDYEYITGGDTWVSVIEFGENPRAKVSLSYGNATQKDSPHNGDQLKLFSEKKLRDAWFTKEQVKENAKSVQVLMDGKFVEE